MSSKIRLSINNTEINIPVHTAFYMLVNASAIHDFCTHMAKAEIPRGETAWSKKSLTC